MMDRVTHHVRIVGGEGGQEGARLGVLSDGDVGVWAVELWGVVIDVLEAH